VDASENAILAALSADERAMLRRESRAVELKLGDVLFEAGDRVEAVTWVEQGLLSVVSYTDEGKSVETTMVGREGAGGLIEACGSGVTFLTVLIQLEGRGWRTPAAVCRDLAEHSPRFRDLVWRYAEAMFAEARQSVVCQAAHGVEARCARWLLESHDRGCVGPVLHLTREYLAGMLGVQRTTVSTVAGALERRGLIRQSRGVFELVDIDGLEATACDCRRAIREHRDRMGLATPCDR